MDIGDIHDPLSLPQIIGYIATIFGILAFQQRDDDRMRILICVIIFFLIIHFVLMGVLSAAISVALSGSRWILSMFGAVKKYRHIILISYGIMFVTAGIMTADFWYHYLPVFGAITSTYALFYCKNLHLRLVLSISGILWVVHNYLALSYGPLVMEAIMLLSNGIMIYRFMAENKKLPKDPQSSFLTRYSIFKKR